MSCICGRRFPNKEERMLDGRFVYYPHRIGNSILICGRKNTKFPYQLFVGPEWPCMLVTYSLITVPSIFFLVNVASLWGEAVVIVGIITLSCLLCFFSLTACSDPGIVFVDNISSNGNNGLDKSEKGQAGIGGGGGGGGGGNEKNSPLVGYVPCGQCDIDRPKTASHCYECNLCVDQLDHHCPWTGKCIAKKNLQTFYYFLWSLLVHIIFVVAMVIASLVRHMDIVPGADFSGPSGG